MDAVVKSPLVWGRGLKHGSERDGKEGVEVALVWGRGLKHHCMMQDAVGISRPSCGGVD